MGKLETLSVKFESILRMLGSVISLILKPSTMFQEKTCTSKQKELRRLPGESKGVCGRLDMDQDGWKFGKEKDGTGSTLVRHWSRVPRRTPDSSWNGRSLG